MIKSVTFSIKLTSFFHEKSKKQEKGAGTNFILVSQSRNLTGRFIKSYLHRRVTILLFITSARIQKCLT